MKENHSILGFHFAGNCNAYVDNRGYLIVEEGDILNKSYSVRRINGIKPVKNKNPDTCWVFFIVEKKKKICDGWVEHRFKYNYAISGDIAEPPIFIHFDFENYKPIMLDCASPNDSNY